MARTRVRRIAVGQGGGPTAVINDTLAGVMYEAKKRKIEVIGIRNGVEGCLHPDVYGNFVKLNFNPKLIRGIPGPYLGSTRKKLDSKERHLIKEIRNNLDQRGIESLFYIGGNDSASTILEEGNGIHLIKTEDNDVPENDHTPGWASACCSNIEIIKRLVCDMSGFSARIKYNERTVYSTAPVVVYQTQGRNTGWITLGSAFAKLDKGKVIIEKAPHLFLTKELPYDRDEFLGKVDNLLRKQGFVFVVCSEEIIDKDGRKLADLYSHKESKDTFGHTEHARSGAFNYAEFFASEIKKGLSKDARIAQGCKGGYIEVKETPITPQHIQRCLMRNFIDAEEAFEVGREAVRAFDEGENNISIALKRYGKNYDIKAVRVPLENVAAKVKHVDKKYIGSINGPSELFYKDFMPLIMSHLGKSKTLDDAPDFIPWQG